MWVRLEQLAQAKLRLVEASAATSAATSVATSGL
jgi:hypothetical protein